VRSVLYAVAILCAVQSGTAYPSGVDEIIQHSRDSMWYAGDGIVPGDFFTYEVCDATDRHRDGHGCYTVRLDFYAVMKSSGRDVWIVQAGVRDDGADSHHVLAVDLDTMGIRTMDYAARHYAESLSRTVLLVADFADRQAPKPLDIGEVWGHPPSVDPYAELVVASRDSLEVQGRDLDVFLVQHRFFETSTIAIHRDVALPVSGVLYDPYWPLPDPPILFVFELTESSAVGGMPESGVP